MLAPNNRYWTPEGDQQLTALWPQDLTIEQIAAHIGRSLNATKARAALLDLPRRTIKWTAEEDDQLRKLWPNLGLTEIERIIGRSKAALKERRVRLGLPSKKYRAVDPFLPLAERGLNDEEIAKKLQLTVPYVRDLAATFRPVPRAKIISPFWTAARKERVTKLWAEGWSATQIASEIGAVSRNAVIGIVCRLGLFRRKRISTVQPRVMRAPQLPRRDSNEISSPDALAIPQEQRRSLLELTTHTCRWPVGEPGQPDFFFCGARTLDKQSYCACHYARAYHKPPRTPRVDNVIKISGFQLRRLG